MNAKYRIITEHTNKRTRKELIDVVTSQGVTVLVDVRLTTRFPLDGRFKPAILKKDLNDAGIKYVRMKGLGNEFKDVKPVSESKRKYLENVVMKGEFNDLIDIVSNKSNVACLICYCEPPKPCHRNWLRDELLSRLETTGAG